MKDLKYKNKIFRGSFRYAAIKGCSLGMLYNFSEGSGGADLFQCGMYGYFLLENNFCKSARYLQIMFLDIKKAEEMSKRAWEVVKNYTGQHHAERLEIIVKKYFN